MGFEIRLTSARISGMPNVPAGWSLSIDNDASWNTAIRGTATVGSAALSTAFFNDFLLIEKQESPNAPFDIRGEIVGTEDFAAEHRVVLSMKDFRTVSM